MALPIIENSNDYFDNFEHNALKSVLLWYLNAGYARFCGVETPNIDKIEEELDDELLDPTQHEKIINEFCQKHAFGRGNFLSCGTCGI